MKKHKVPMNKRRLAAIARWLEAGAPHKKNVVGFSMLDGIVVHEVKKTAKETLSCGTTCCIAGAAVQFFNDPENFVRTYANPSVYLGERKVLSWGATVNEAQELLGLGYSKARELFIPAERAKLEQYNNPAWAARVVRGLIATGEVDWEKYHE